MINTKFLIVSVVAGLITTVLIKIFEPEILDFKNKVRKEGSVLNTGIKGKEVI